jgi:hypothetical protein
MKAIILCFLMTCNLFLFGQKPSEKQIQDQMQQAMSEAKIQAAELRKDIADMKAKGENPEEIAEMEKQLAMLEKMTGMLNRTSDARKNIPKETVVPKAIVAKYNSPVIHVSLNTVVKPPTLNEAKDQLLWYKGKKIDKNTLITTSGKVIRYDRANHQVIIDPGQKKDSTPYIFMDRMLGKMSIMQNEFVIKVDGLMNSFFMSPQIDEAYDEFEIMKERYYEMAPNTITIIVDSRYVHQQLWQQLLDNMNSLEPVKIEAPPNRKTLCTCLSKSRKEYEFEIKQWKIGFYENELGLFNLYKQLTAYMQDHPEIVSQLEKTNFFNDYNKAINLVISRMRDKLADLSSIYEKGNVLVEDGLVYATIEFSKFLDEAVAAPVNTETANQLKSDGYRTIQHVGGLVIAGNIFSDYIKAQKQALNYNVIFDYSFYINHENNKELLAGAGATYKTPENFAALWYEDLRKFNRFKLKMKMEFEAIMGKAGDDEIVKANGNLQTEELIVSLGRSYPCKWQLYLTNADYRKASTDEEKYYIPVNILGGVKEIFPKTGNKETYSYSGPPTAQMVFPTVRMDFCNQNVKDYALLDVLRYNDADSKVTVNPKKQYKNDFMIYANKMFVGIAKTGANTSALVDLAGEMMNVQGSTAAVPAIGNPQLYNLRKAFVIQQTKTDLQVKLSEATHTTTLVLFDAQNGSPLLISKPANVVDAADADQGFLRLTKGIINISVEHAPQ